MDVIKFELKTAIGQQHTLMEASLGGSTIEDYLVAFKAFLIACGYGEQTVEEIQMMENARYIVDKERDENNF